MTIQEAALQLRLQLLRIYEKKEAVNITDMVIENVTGWQKIDRIVNKNNTLNTAQEELLEKYSDALVNHEPVQYVLHETWFGGMKLYTDENVLIPRPETEELVDWVIKDLTNNKSTVKIIDIGTGSGCIPLTIKKYLPPAEVHACDVSNGALAVAKKNATDQNLAINFHLLDILNDADRNQLPVFDIIISNPPYIPQKDKLDMAVNVLAYEPQLALFVPNEDPLLFYSNIANFAATHLSEHGCIYLEIHEAMGKAVIDLYKQKGFKKIDLRKDLQGKDRMIRVQL